MRVRPRAPRLAFWVTLVGVFGVASLSFAADERPTAEPVDITGVAVDEEGKPVGGATIVLASANRYQAAEPRLAATTAAADGSFAFRQVELPLDRGERHAEAKFEVYGLAEGFGYTWQGTRSFRPTAAPEQRGPEESGRIFYQGEPITTALTFGLPATLRGKITDDSGKPLAGARVELGIVRNERTGRSMWRCAWLESSPRKLHPDDRSFGSIRLLPTARVVAETDQAGNYVLTGLPREANLLGRISYQPGYEPKQFTLATTTVPQPRMECLGYVGVLNHVFQVPRLVRVHVTREDTSSPAKNVRVRVRAKRLLMHGNQATTDEDGRLELWLTPGEYVLVADPGATEPYLQTEQSIEVAEETQAQAVELALKRGAMIELSAVDAGSGEPVAGVDFRVGPDTSPDRHRLQSQTVFVDNPATDSRGRLQAVLPAGSYQFVVGSIPPGFEAVRKTSDPCQLAAGESSDVRFEFRRVEPAQTKVPAEPVEPVGENLYPAALVEKWNHQRSLLERGRAKLSMMRVHAPWLEKDKLEAILHAADPDKIPDLIGELQREYPDQRIASAETEIRTDGRWHRETSSFDGAVSDVLATNGQEGIQYHPSSAQADVYALTHFSLGLTKLRELCYWSREPAPRKRDGKDELRVTVEPVDGWVGITIRPAGAEPAGWNSTILADAKSGFIHSTISDHGVTGTQRWQFAPKFYENGAIVPGLYVEFSHQNGKVGRLEIRRIESLELDAEFAPADFVVSVPAGTNVIDYRDGSSGNPKGRVAYEPVFDVVSFANSIPEDARQRAEVIQVGAAAPAVEPEHWLNQSGSASAPDLKGKVLLVEFWGIGCGPCIAQLPEVQEAAQRNADRGLVIVGLHNSGETVEAVADFARKRGLTYPLAIDRGGPKGFFGATFAAYGVRGIPQAAVIDRAGRLAHLGNWDQAIAKAEELLEGAAK